MTRIISAEEVRKHNKSKDLWIVVGDVVWDITEFAPNHPGGFAGLSHLDFCLLQKRLLHGKWQEEQL